MTMPPCMGTVVSTAAGSCGRSVPVKSAVRTRLGRRRISVERGASECRCWCKTFMTCLGIAEQAGFHRVRFRPDIRRGAACVTVACSRTHPVGAGSAEVFRYAGGDASRFVRGPVTGRLVGEPVLWPGSAGADATGGCAARARLEWVRSGPGGLYPPASKQVRMAQSPRRAVGLHPLFHTTLGGGVRGSGSKLSGRGGDCTGNGATAGAAHTQRDFSRGTGSSLARCGAIRSDDES